jgi:uncharacterized protein YpmS
MTTEQVQQFENSIQSTLENPAPNGEVTITITEQQLNSYIEAQMASQKDLTITNPSVHLTEGQIIVSGKITMDIVTTDAQAVLVPTLDSNGKPVIHVQSLKVGSITVPDNLKNQLEQQVQNLLADYISSNAPDMKVKEIKITEGQMTLIGSSQ